MSLEQIKTELIKIGTCASAFEAAYLKSVFADNEVFCFIQGENHHQLLGGLGSIELNILVSSSQVETARELLDEVRMAQKHGRVLSEDWQLDNVIPFPKVFSRSLPSSFQSVTPKKTWVAIFLALFVTFGAGHLYAGAWKRCIFLAVVQSLAVVLVMLGYSGLFVGLLLLAPLLDLLGSSLILRHTNQKSI